MSTLHHSDSTEQRLAERHALQALEQELDATFDVAAKLPISMSVKPDGIDPVRKIVVEVFARIGKLKSAQQHKVRGGIC